MISMSVSKGSHEFRTVIDIGSQKMSESKLKKILRKTSILNCEKSNRKFIFIDNQIDIGIYRIMLLLDDSPGTRLKDYGRFTIRVFELFPQEQKEIDLKKDYRFKGYSWITHNENDKFYITDLVQAILTCYKLNVLKAFN